MSKEAIMDYNKHRLICFAEGIEPLSLMEFLGESE